MRNHQRHVRAEPVALQLLPLHRQVDRSGSVRVYHDGGDSLRQQRIGAAELRCFEPLTGMRVRIDESRRDV